MVSLNSINIKGLDQTLYYEKLDNGLEVYLLPYDNKKNWTMHYATKFGSIATSFVPFGQDKEITVPDGIAHFLEHKMFEQEDGIDPFTFASKTGTYSNASTNYTCTQYLFEGNKCFKENLDYLLNFVGSPYFTDENVEKEKGIIAEEIKQYDDEVEWFFDEEMKKAMLNKDNHRVDIAGTVETINKITKEDLYNTYYTFYQPSNMFLVITGSFNVNEAMDVIKNNKSLNENKVKFDIKVKKEKETLKVKDKEVTKKFNIHNTKVGYGVKLPVGDNDKFLFYAYIALLVNTKFGASSLFREKLKKEGLITSFYIDREIIDDYVLLFFKADTKKPKELVEAIRKELNNIKITEEEIERMKKVWISSYVMTYDDINGACDNIIDDIIIYDKFIDNKIELYRSLNKKDCMNMLKGLDFTNSSVVTIIPNKKKED